MKNRLFLFCWLIFGLTIGGFVNSIGNAAPIKVVIIDADDISDDIANGFREVFSSNGCITTIIQRNDVISFEFSVYDIIVISPANYSAWQNYSAIPDSIYASSKPIIGLGKAGYYLFGINNLPIGNPQGMHISNDSTVLLKSTGPYYDFPNIIPIPADSTVTLYTSAHRVGIHYPEPVAGVNPIGMGKKYGGYLYIATFENRFLLWGYNESADSLTNIGNDLLMNLVYYMAGRTPADAPPDHWDFKSGTGNYATVVIPSAIQPAIGSELLESGDFIGAFTPDNVCAGWIEWQNVNAALSVWGDNNQTPDIDGFRVDEQISYRIFQTQTQQEFTDVVAAYAQGDGLYANNAFMILSQLNALAPGLSVLFVPADTLDFAPNITTLSFPLENHGSGELIWSAAAQPEKPWLVAIDPSNGIGNAEIQVTVDHQQLTVPADTTDIIIQSNGGTGQITVIIRQSTELPPHWDFPSQTGNNATVIIPAEIQPTVDGAPLLLNDYIGVFTPSGLCCGWRQWNGENLGITIWGDDDQTPEIDGFQTGELMFYRVFRSSVSREWTNIEVAYSQGNGRYSTNTIFILGMFHTFVTEIPFLYVEPDTLNFGTTTDTMMFHIENHGSGVLEWSLTRSFEKSWLTDISPENGTGDTEVWVVVDRQYLTEPADTAKIIINSSGGNGEVILFIEKPSDDFPDHWEYKPNTGNNATVIIPAETEPTVDGAALLMNDYIGVFTQAGLCCGWRQWTGENLGITIWGDDDQTPEIDGFQTGELMFYRVFRSSVSREWTNIEVAYSQGNGLYSTNTIFILGMFHTFVTEIPLLYVEPDTLNFGTTTDTMMFHIENHGSVVLEWSLTRAFEKAWLTEIIPESGTGDTEVRVVTDRQFLTDPADTAKIIINSNGGNGEVILFIEKPSDDFPDHWRFKPNTGNNVTVVLPTTANPNIDSAPLLTGDIIGVFTPAGLCCGHAAWNHENIAIAVWGDNPQSPDIDGFQSQEQLYYRVFRPATACEWTSANVEYSQGTGLYEANQFMVINRFDVITTSVAQAQEIARPQCVQLQQNYPNPFNAQTTIRYDIIESANVDIMIMDIRGAVVRQWNFQNQATGSHQVIWNGRDQNEANVASGVYFCRLSVRNMNSNTQIIRKLIFLK